MHKIAMIGTGLIGRFYTMSLKHFRGKDEIVMACSKEEEEAAKFAEEFGIPRYTTDMAKAIQDPEVDTELWHCQIICIKKQFYWKQKLEKPFYATSHWIQARKKHSKCWKQ